MRAASFPALLFLLLIAPAFVASAADGSRYIELDANTQIKLPPEQPAREPGQEDSAAAGGTAEPDDWERAEKHERRGRRTAPPADGEALSPRAPAPPAPEAPQRRNASPIPE